MNYKEARVYLDGVSKYGSVLGLDTIRNLLDELGNPQDGLRFIHVAGTNGKGSVLAYVSSILSEEGFVVGRYVSPTVISYRERIQVGGRWIEEEEFAALTEKVQKAVACVEADGRGHPTVFEIETAMAFLYFRDRKCDYVVLETGLGGRLDATNIINNTVLAVFSTISLDHVGILGNTLEEIAGEKAGIIKPGCVAVSAAQKPKVCAVLEERAAQCRCPLIFAKPEEADVIEENYLGQTFSYQGMHNLKIRLAGKCQIENVVTALEAVRALSEVPKGPVVSGEAIRRGLERTVWAGRFTCIGERPLFIVDGAHNEDAARQLRRTLETYFSGKRLICIMGVFKDKEYEKIVDIMAPLAARVYTINLPDAGRTLDAQSLKEVFEAAYRRAAGFDVDEGKRTGGGNRVEAVGDILQAVRLAMAEAGEEDVVLAFGSLSYLGRVMEIVRKGMNGL